MDEVDMVLEATQVDWQENRRQRFLGALDWSSTRGIEIGPLAAPLARRPEANVRYVDVVATEGLQQKYAGDPNVVNEDIVQVDAVWGSKTLAECFPQESEFDWVIASHVVEHVPDLIGWLKQIDSILRIGGRLYLAVPDYRVTFDRFRTTSTLAEIVAAHLQGAQQPSLAQIFSQTLYFSNLTSNEIWQATPDPANHLSLEQLRLAWETTRYAAQSGDAVDLHCWVFTPLTWFQNLLALTELGLLHYRCCEYVATGAGENEFFVTLEKLNPGDGQATAQACGGFREHLRAMASSDGPSGTLTHEEYLGVVLAQQSHGGVLPKPVLPTATGSWRSRVSDAATTQPLCAWLARTRDVPAASALGAEIPPHQPLYSGYEHAIDEDHAQIAGLSAPGGLIDVGLPGYLRVPDAMALYELAYFSAGDVLEVVAHSPLSSLFFGQAIINAGRSARLVSVETITDYAPLAQAAMTNLGLDDLCERHAGEPLPLLDKCIAAGERFGLIFIDFDQSREALSPIATRLPALLKPGGCVVFHDFNDVNNSGPEPLYQIYSVVEDLLGSGQFVFVDVIGCCAILQQISAKDRHLAE